MWENIKLMIWTKAKIDMTIYNCSLIWQDSTKSIFSNQQCMVVTRSTYKTQVPSFKLIVSMGVFAVLAFCLHEIIKKFKRNTINP